MVASSPQGRARIEAAKPTWFFEHPDGQIIAVQEDEAWRIYQGKNQIAGQRNFPPKIIGVGEGIIFQKAVKEAIDFKNRGGLLSCEPSKEIIPAIEAVDPTENHPGNPAIPAKNKCDKCNQNWEIGTQIPICLKSPSSEELAKEMIRKGYDDELATARGNIRPPRNFDMIDQQGQPTTTQKLINQF